MALKTSNEILNHKLRIQPPLIVLRRQGLSAKESLANSTYRPAGSFVLFSLLFQAASSSNACRIKLRLRSRLVLLNYRVPQLPIWKELRNSWIPMLTISVRLKSRQKHPKSKLFLPLGSQVTWFLKSQAGSFMSIEPYWSYVRLCLRPCCLQKLSNFKEKFAPEILLPGKDATEIEQLLQGIYPDQGLFISKENCLALMKLSTEYQIDRLKIRCEEYLRYWCITDMTVDEALEVIIVSQRYPLEKWIVETCVNRFVSQTGDTWEEIET